MRAIEVDREMLEWVQLSRIQEREATRSGKTGEGRIRRVEEELWRAAQRISARNGGWISWRPPVGT